MRTALPICVLLTVCGLIPLSASAREYRSATVKHEFQLTHPCPSTGLTSGACPGYIKDHIIPLACGGPDAPRICNGKRSGMLRQRINGKLGAARGRSLIGAPSRSPRNQRRGGRTGTNERRGIVNLAARGMLVVSVARRLGSEGPLLAYCAAPL
jgi:hypothetical protein